MSHWLDVNVQKLSNAKKCVLALRKKTKSTQIIIAQIKTDLFCLS